MKNLKNLSPLQPIFARCTWTRLLTYSDLRFGDGDIYLNNGFEPIGSTELDYYYTDFFSRINRFKLRAQGGKTEKQIAMESGVVRIYGTGSNIYLLG
jgi:hypothetical protein